MPKLADPITIRNIPTYSNKLNISLRNIAANIKTNIGTVEYRGITLETSSISSALRQIISESM